MKKDKVVVRGISMPKSLWDYVKRCAKGLDMSVSATMVTMVLSRKSVQDCSDKIVIDSQKK